MSDEQPCCGKCRFSAENDGGFVECRRYAPRIGDVADWPLVHTSQWCGEYQARN
jgi:hypothetical protein